MGPGATLEFLRIAVHPSHASASRSKAQGRAHLHLPPSLTWLLLGMNSGCLKQKVFTAGPGSLKSSSSA